MIKWVIVTIDRAVQGAEGDGEKIRGRTVSSLEEKSARPYRCYGRRDGVSAVLSERSPQYEPTSAVIKRTRTVVGLLQTEE